MKSLLYWITSFLPCRIIDDGQTPYLERYYLGSLFGWTFYLHQFVGSDPDRGLHDHPWRKAYSIILSGWYWEETRMGIRKVRWFNSLTGDTFHRVVLPCAHTYPDMTCNDHARAGISHPIAPDMERPCWSLFFHTSKNVKKWGFLKPMADSSNPGSAYFQPYLYTREGNQKEWYLTAPTGRAIRKAMIARAFVDYYREKCNAHNQPIKQERI